MAAVIIVVGIVAWTLAAIFREVSLVPLVRVPLFWLSIVVGVGGILFANPWVITGAVALLGAWLVVLWEPAWLICWLTPWLNRLIKTDAS